MVHVEDIARAFIAILQAPRETVHNQAFNIGSNGENYRILDLAKNRRENRPGMQDRVCQGCRPRQEVLPGRFREIPFHFPRLQAKWDARTGREEIYESYKKYGIRQEDFEGPRYKRIDHIKQLISTGRLDETLRWATAESLKISPERHGYDAESGREVREICRFCGSPLSQTFVDLGMSPLCESYRSAEQLNQMEPFYPLHVYVCGRLLPGPARGVRPAGGDLHRVRLLFLLLGHLARPRQNVCRDGDGAVRLDGESFVVELASNDGYLLQYFVREGDPGAGRGAGRQCGGGSGRQGDSDPGEILRRADGPGTGVEGQQADLILGNNVLAQVPDLNDFVRRMKILLKPGGVITMEFPAPDAAHRGEPVRHDLPRALLLLLLRDGGDGSSPHTAWFSSTSKRSRPTEARCGSSAGIQMTVSKAVTDAVPRAQGTRRRLWSRPSRRIRSFAEKVKETKRKLLEFLIRAKREGKRIAGYGAPGKGNTLLNYCGIRTDFLDFTVDRNPYKQGKFLPGTHIPIHSPDRIAAGDARTTC